jgi:hypothetical protein
VSTLAVVVSLVVCVATAGLWVRSYSGALWWKGDISHLGAITVEDGSFKYCHWTKRDQSSPQWARMGVAVQVLRFYRRSLYGKQVGTILLVIVPCWMIVTISGIAPSLWGVAFARRSCQKKSGRCTTCGYNLTGNTSGVCPECGTPVAGKVEAKA